MYLWLTIAEMDEDQISFSSCGDMVKQRYPHFASHYRQLILTRHLGIKIQANSILDVGCDDGHFLSQQSGQLRVGLDLRPRVTPHDDLLVVQADGCTLPFTDQSFSTIFAFDIIEHILDDATFIASLLRALAPGGQLWLSTPTDTSYLFPAWLTRRAMNGWGHYRVGYNVDDLISHFSPGFFVQINLWNAWSFRHCYWILWGLAKISSPLAWFCARLCFEVDRLLPTGHDHIFLQIIRKDGTDRFQECAG